MCLKIIIIRNNAITLHLPGDKSLPKIGQEEYMLRKIVGQEDPIVTKSEPGPWKAFSINKLSAAQKSFHRS